MADAAACVECVAVAQDESSANVGLEQGAVALIEDSDAKAQGGAMAGENGLKTYYDPLDASTFVPPTPLPAPSVTIEFCDRCRWLHRASWVCTELLLTFAPPALRGVHLVPLAAPETAGRFRVWLHLTTAAAGVSGEAESAAEGEEAKVTTAPVLVWDRKIEGGLPELRELVRRACSR